MATNDEIRRDLERVHAQDSVLRVDPDLCVHGNHPADGCAICATTGTSRNIDDVADKK